MVQCASLFCQLARAQSLREICGGLRCCLGEVVHLGMREAPRRSTLSYANGHRPWQLYRDVFEQLTIIDGPRIASCGGFCPAALIG